ncbi:MAG: hypothetical protein CMM25_00600 [Rhodospirillaceae bacterium]|nr:hypothetical protein [Rhodospirillaceae bacterium]|tara:strand:+ start:780 stop:1250 length:471 start_codon:yes stop_codon:yes gene_type:complete
MSEKDVVYALELLHTVQIKREALGFASFVDEHFSNLSKEDKDKLWTEYLKPVNMWSDKDMLDFARISTQGHYGDYSGCRTIESKLSRYKKIQKEMINSGKEWDWMHNLREKEKEEKEKKIVKLAKEISFRMLATTKHPDFDWLVEKLREYDQEAKD